MSAPESPMNSLAGLQFSGRKPMQAPISTAAMNEATAQVNAILEKERATP